MSGLPYDGTPPPEPEAAPATVQEDAGEPAALDMALDDYVPASGPIPEHVQSLMGRMGRGKVYLLEESPAIVHVDAEERVRGDPRTAALAAQLDLHDPTEWLVAASSGSPSAIRTNALFVRSDIIKHLSTSKVFSWVTSLGATAMGIEWLNDETLVVLFSTPAAALLGLTLLAKAGFDPAEGDDPLLERAAHSVPIHLLPQAELDPKDKQAGKELLAGDDDSKMETEGVRRRGRGNFAGDTGGRFDLPALAPANETNEWNIAQGVDPNARVTVRYATEADGSLRRQADQSDWYKRHGRRAGKETASGPRGFTRDRYEEGLSFRGRGGEDGREFAKRLGRERRREPYARPPRDGRDGRSRKTVEDMDAELDRMARRRNGEDVDMDDDRDGGRDGGGGGGGRDRGHGRTPRREKRGKDDLDKELDDLFAARSAANND